VRADVAIGDSAAAVVRSIFRIPIDPPLAGP